ncbi:hypothetical protein ACA910_018697 [Epithemia clementina (nom. ined.)]
MTESLNAATETIWLGSSGEGLVGGALIGLSAAILLLFSGEIMGSSGIVNSLLLNHPMSASFKDPAQHWKLVFVATFLIVAQVPSYFFQQGGSSSSIGTVLKTAADQQPSLAYVLGGLLVGFGTKLSNGCTSGHGICGLARLSRRSFTAVSVFMTVAIVATVLNLGDMLRFFLEPTSTNPVTVVSNSSLITEARQLYSQLFQYTPIVATSLVALLTLVVLYTVASTYYGSSRGESNAENLAKILPGAVAGAVFAQGLLISGMINPSTVMAFLNVANIPNGTWDSTLLAVMCSGVLVSFISYQFIQGYNVVAPFCLPSHHAAAHHYKKVASQEPTPKKQQPQQNQQDAPGEHHQSPTRISKCVVCLTHPLAKPVSLPLGSTFHIPTNTTIDYALILGAACFGLGWSLVGLCPAPAIFSAALGIPQVLLLWWPAYVAGIHWGDRYKNRLASKQ